MRVVLNDLEGLPSHWLNLEQLRTFCQAWEAALFRAMTIHEESSEEQQSCSLNTVSSVTWVLNLVFSPLTLPSELKSPLDMGRFLWNLWRGCINSEVCCVSFLYLILGFLFPT